MAGGTTKHLRGAAAQAHKEKEAKMGAEHETHEEAPPPAKRRGRPPGSGAKKRGKGAKETEEAGGMAEEEEHEEEPAAKKPRDITKKIKALMSEPRAESGQCYWCMKDKPGPTRLVGGPSMAASELVDMVQDMGTFCWDGVRDEASNAFLRKMRAGDIACLFHGGASERAVVGQMEIVNDPRPDPTAWDPDSPYFDAHSKESKPKWYCVDVRLIKVLPRFLTLAELNMKADELPLHNEMISQPRLCIFPAPKDEWDILFSLPDQPPPANLPMPPTPAGAR